MIDTDRVPQALAVPLHRALGLRLADPGDPAAGIVLDVGEVAGNGAGGLHASALGAALELAGYLAVLPALDGTEHAVTHAVATQLVSGAASGERVTACGELDRRTRRLAFVSVVARVGERVVGRAQLVKSIVAWSG